MTNIVHRIALGLEYDGTDFVGWQIQRSGRTVQETLANAVSKIANENLSVFGAGRTDARVHAEYQVAHFDTSSVRDPRQWLLGINSNLPNDVVVRWVRTVDSKFDARHSALLRTYRYLIKERETRSALLRNQVWWWRQELDQELMKKAAALLIGEHDFSAFRASSCQSHSPIRRLDSVVINRRYGLLQIEFTANAFLQHMVRNIVGVLTDVGCGKASPSWAAEVLKGRDRKKAGVTAPPQGLSLIGVTYPYLYDFPDFSK
ncbi:MAG: tRNA pseudouridine(38-40) synthase TruA [Rhodospirillaceae bacterium]|nr:tRNA pseudouridine(38-40) synthase TruA [Rhodospirillaceae bacterium]